MRTTDECKEFLVEFFKKNPQIIKTMFTGMSNIPHLQTIVENKKNWKRLWKTKVSNCDYFYDNSCGIYVNGKATNKYGETETNMPISNFEIARGFDCDNSQHEFEGQVAFIVVETKDGELFLSDYIGD